MLLVIAAASFSVYAAWTWTPSFLAVPVTLVAIAFLALIVWFFRVPARSSISGTDDILSPADGKVVAIEMVREAEYFNTDRRQVSIFMSPMNVHVNWYPINGLVTYTKYHPGRYLVAWHPKSSTENERSTVVIKGDRCEVLVRQIAGALARRICTYAAPGALAVRARELGFIKFGSRVDLLLPLDAEILVVLGQQVQGATTVIARTTEPNQ